MCIYSFVLMKSKTLKDGTHPIVLQVRYQKRTQRRNTGLSAKIVEFHDGFFTRKHSDYKSLNEKIEAWNNSLKSCTIPDDCFTVLKDKTKSNSLAELIYTIMDELKSQGRMATWLKNRDLLKSITNYRLPNISGIDYEFLKGYETHLLSNGCSGGGVKAYIRTLKVVVNESIKRGLLKPELYPFKNSMNPQGYSTSHLKSTYKPRPVSVEELEIIKSKKGSTKNIEEARKYWLISYFLCGMNLKDLVYLKPDQVGESINILRKKTGHDLSVPVHDIARQYMEDLSEGGRYYLPVIQDIHNTPEKEYARYRYFNRKINDGLALFAKENGIKKFTMYQARFTFATHMNFKGVGISKISQLLGHGDVSITQRYLGKFGMEDMKDVSDML